LYVGFPIKNDVAMDTHIQKTACFLNTTQNGEHRHSKLDIYVAEVRMPTAAMYFGFKRGRLFNCYFYIPLCVRIMEFCNFKIGLFPTTIKSFIKGYNSSKILLIN
jgi:hypothetical protein